MLVPALVSGPKMGVRLSNNQTNVTRHTINLGQSVAELTGRQAVLYSQSHTDKTVEMLQCLAQVAATDTSLKVSGVHYLICEHVNIL